MKKTISKKKKEKYEIELERHEPIDKETEILLRLEEIEKKYNEIKDQIDTLKLNNKMNEEEKNNIIKEIKEDIDISKKIKEILNDKEIKNMLFNEFEKEISNKYMKKDEFKKEDEEIENKVNQLIKEKDTDVNKIKRRY